MKKSKSINRIAAFYLIIPIIVVIIAYVLLPTILNYPPNSIDNDLQKEIDGLTYTVQFILITIMCISIVMFILFRGYKKIKLCNKEIAKNNGDKQKWVDELTKISVRTPLIVYASQILIPLVLIPVIIAMIGAEAIVVFKISIIFILFFSLSATMSFIFAQKEFQKMIMGIYSRLSDCENNIINYKPKIRIKTRMIFELVPLIVIALVFTALLAYTMNTKIIGNIYYDLYDAQLKENFNENQIYTYEEIEDKIKKIENIEKNIAFIISNDGTYKTFRNDKLSDFFVKYALKEKIHSNRTYDYYCIDREGTFIELKCDNGQIYIVGLMYETGTISFLNGLVVSCIIMFFIILVTLIYIASNFSKDIELINDGLRKILKQQDLSKGLIVASNDETGELMQSYNKIQELTQEHIKEINEKQDLLIRQEKLTILGEMAGGMAHDINNPASAINMSINVLYNIDDKEEKNKILDNMSECVKRILAIVSSVRDQFRNIGETKKEKFKINDVLKNIEIVIHNQLNKYHCNLDINYDNDFDVFGEKNKLNQVLSNIIMNSILAYKDIEKNGNIIVDIDEDENYNIIKVTDFAGGIPEKIRDKLFTKILTTRGTQGTGLGLYLAKSIIEDEFNGKIYFETETDKGTTFFIKLKKMED